jgi:hypothetical protein
MAPVALVFMKPAGGITLSSSIVIWFVPSWAVSCLTVAGFPSSRVGRKTQEVDFPV